jgi:hypothetical protein
MNLSQWGAAVLATTAVLAASACGDGERGTAEERPAATDGAATTTPDARDHGGRTRQSPSSTGANTAEPDRQRTPADRLAPGVEYEKGSDEAQVAYMIDGLYSSMAAADAEGFCKRVSSAAKREIARDAPGSGGPKVACEQTFPSLLRKLVDEGLRRSLTAEIEAVDLNGDTGTVTVSFGDTKREVPVTKDGSAWRLAANEP